MKFAIGWKNTLLTEDPYKVQIGIIDTDANGTIWIDSVRFSSKENAQEYVTRNHCCLIQWATEVE